MNILVRMDSAHGKQRLESCLPQSAWNLYFARDNSLMFNILKYTQIHIVVLGVFLDEATVFETLRLLHQSEFIGKAPVIICCCARKPTIGSGSKSLELACMSMGAKYFLDSETFYDESFTITIERIFNECLDAQALNSGA